MLIGVTPSASSEGAPSPHQLNRMFGLSLAYSGDFSLALYTRGRAPAHDGAGALADPRRALSTGEGRVSRADAHL